METMSASDLVDYSVNSAVETVSDENSYDLHNLTAYNNHPIKLSTSNIEELLLKESRKLAQSLVTKIFNCELEQGAAGPVALLPAEIFRIPRAKRIPEPKAQTRWEKFAAEKGIKKKKRDRMVYDDEMDEYRPRYGYKRANGGIENEAIVEIKPGDDPYADPWSASKQEKKERVQKNLKNQTKNLIRAGKDMNGDKMKIFDPSATPGIPVDLEHQKSGPKRGKGGVERALQIVQHSTASMGRFDELRKGESERKITGKRRAFRDNFGESPAAEKETMKAQLRIVEDKISKKARGVTNSLAAYEGIIPDAPSGEFKAKKGKGKITNSSETKSKKKLRK